MSGHASTGKGSPLFAPWSLGSLPDGEDPKALRAALADRLRALEHLINGMRLAMVYGPVAGSYVPFFFGGSDATSGLKTGIVDQHTTPVSIVPVAASVWVDDPTSQLTVRLRYDDGVPADILDGSWQFTGSGFKDMRLDFDGSNLDPSGPRRVPDRSKVYLEIVSLGDGGTPVPASIRCTLWGKGCSRIEPTT